MHTFAQDKKILASDLNLKECMVAAPNNVKNTPFSFRLTNKISTIKSYASIELLNLACYRVQTISYEGDTVREK